MKFKFLFLLFAICYLLFAIFSYGFVDANFPLNFSKGLSVFFFYHRPLITAIFCSLIISFFALYLFFLNQIKNHQYSGKQICWLIGLTIILLFFSWPGFSNDIFNYIATAKVTYFYKENPYLVMPIEFTGEPMLKFMHAANKTALYAPLWIILTAIPHLLGFGNMLLTVFTFKAFVAGFYLICAWLVWRLSGGNLYSLAFFALNPLVIVEALISGHSDVVMMAFVLLAIYLLFQKKKVLPWMAFLASIGIKYATIILTPLFVFSSRLKKEKLITWAAWLMFLVFLLSPLREEIYSWYFIWVISLVALLPKNKLLFWLVIGFSFGLLLRYIPWLYYRNWGGLTPQIKTLTTFIPPGLTLAFFSLKKLRK